MSPPAGKLTLPYLAGALWAEREILAGNPVSRRHEITLDLDALPEKQKARAIRLRDDVWFGVGAHRAFVHGTGIDDAGYAIQEDDDDWLVDPIDVKLPPLPEVAEPTSDVDVVLCAYEEWATEFRKQSRPALRAWAHRWKDEDETFREAVGIKSTAWQDEISVRRSGNGGKTVIVTADDLDLFAGVRAAHIRRNQTAQQVAKKSLDAAAEICGRSFGFDQPLTPLDDVVEAYVAYTSRFCSIAMAHHRTTQALTFDFEDDMRAWADDHGSDQLRMGLQDGFRMIKVYLEERIAREVPGGYALAADRVTWSARVAPTELALHLRRAVQANLDANSRKGPVAKATIGWLREAPDEITREYDDDGDYIGPRLHGYSEEAHQFEAVIVPEWLGRYVLVGPVHTAESPLPPYLTHWLNPQEFDSGYGGPIQTPPFVLRAFGGDGSGGFATSDFAASPTPSGDDEIPF